MSDETDQQGAALPEGQDAPPAETTAPDSRPDNQTPEPDTGAKSEAGDKKEETPPAGSGQQKQEHKPTSRRSAETRIRDLVSENNRLTKENDQLKGRPSGQDATDDDGEPQHDEQPDISTTVKQEVDKALEPVLKHQRQTVDDSELNELFTGDNAPKRARYEPQIRRMWEMPQYRDTAAADLLKILSYDEDVKDAGTRAVEAHRKAQKEAKESSGAGASDASNRSEGGPAAAMTDEEILKNNEKVKAQG